MVDFNRIINNLDAPKVVKKDLREKINKIEPVEVNGKYYKIGQKIIEDKHKEIIVRAACEKIEEEYKKSIIPEKREVWFYMDENGVGIFRWRNWTNKWPLSITGSLIDSWVYGNREIQGEELVDKMEGVIRENVGKWFENKWKMNKELEKESSEARVREIVRESQR